MAFYYVFLLRRVHFLCSTYHTVRHRIGLCNWFYVCNVLFSNNNQDIEGQGDSVKETTTQRTILGLIWNKIVQWWNRHVAFVFLCVIEVAMDPLFFYLPMINLQKKCIGFDKKLWLIAIVVRSVNDFIYLLHFIWQFRTVFIYKTKLRYLWPFLLDILVILPIPQVRESSPNYCFGYVVSTVTKPH